jgi:hypothetical protein
VARRDIEVAVMVQKSLHRLSIWIGVFFLTACASLGGGAGSQGTPAATISLMPDVPTATVPVASLWISPAVPDKLRQAALTAGVTLAAAPEIATARMDEINPPQASGEPSTSVWFYALVAPFPTIPDGVSLMDVRNAWAGTPSGPFSGRPLWMDPSTLAAFTELWGAPASGAVKTIAADQLITSAWADRPAWAIVPFEGLEPRWKVLTVDGQSPIHNDFNPTEYPLKITFGSTLSGFSLPQTNRDPNKLTVLVMTGTTSLVRGTAEWMELKGVLYPGEFVRSVLRGADITHISNEVSFDPACPTPSTWSPGFQFCSRPGYIALLDDMGVDVVELTGNHLLDYGPSDFLTTIDMYDQRGWLHYGGGRNLAEALKPALIVHNGNKLAFVGCNLSGPKTDWATDASPGAAPCNMDQMHAEIQLLRSQGYIPIMTFQYDEYYTYTPTEYEQRDFRGMADAGAVIVSGSQSHMTAAPEFYGNSFIHYGLGNLFFDQMVHIMPDGSVSQITRNEFIDRHVFYDGRYIGTELLTYILEHYSRPRPMTEYERTQLLEAIFHAAGW